MESFGNVPTKESLTARLEDLGRQKETYMNRLTQAQDTPVSNLFSEGGKHDAIRNHQTALDQVNIEIKSCEEKLAGLNS